MSNDDHKNVAVISIINFRGLIPLVKHVDNNRHPLYDKWHFPGGRVKNGENPRQAAVREVREETGIILLEDRIQPAGHTRDGKKLRLWYYYDLIEPPSEFFAGHGIDYAALVPKADILKQGWTNEYILGMPPKSLRLLGF